MSLFDDLDTIFTTHTHYYTVALSDMNEALEKCARVTGGNAQVINYAGQIILASQGGLSNQIPWLTEIQRPLPPEEPTVEEPTEE